MATWREHRRVALDTAPLIYFLTGQGERAVAVRGVLLAAAQGDVELVLSTVSEAELLVAPLRQPDPEAASRPVHELLAGPPAFDVRPVSGQVARLAASYRARWNLRLADALVAASAVDAGCDALLGNDARFHRLELPELRYLHLDDLLER